MKWGKADFSAFQNLAKNLTEADVEPLTESVLKELAARALRRIKQKTPVDSGTLRRNWKVGDVIRKGNTFSIEIYNPTEYGMYVEYGHRTKGGKGFVPGRYMMTISMDEIDRLSERIIQTRIKQFLEALI